MSDLCTCQHVGFDTQSEDGKDSVPASIRKLGSYSGHNNARDFATAVRLPVVGVAKK